MKYIGWFNLAAAAFSALQAIHGVGFEYHVWLCAANIFSAGVMFNSKKLHISP